MNPSKTKSTGILRGNQATWLVVLIGASLLSGCKGEPDFPRVAVQGTVQVDNRPLTQGVIRLIPNAGNNGPTVQAPIKDGQYSFDRQLGPVSGSHRVEIEAIGFQDFDLDDDAQFAKAVVKNGGIRQQPIPPHYNRQSQLSTNVPAEGSKTLDFKLVVQGTIQ